MKPQTYLFPSRSSRRKGLQITARAGSGSIYFDHQDLSHLDIQAVRQQIGVVLQSGRLLGASLYQNIIGSVPLTIDDAWAAARMAGLEADIKAMPMGMHTVITEGGGGSSGGQRRRLMITRALVKKPRILFLTKPPARWTTKPRPL